MNRAAFNPMGAVAWASILVGLWFLFGRHAVGIALLVSGFALGVLLFLSSGSSGEAGRQ